MNVPRRFPLHGGNTLDADLLLRQPPKAEKEPGMVCPACGGQLISQHCKLFCSNRPRCGYFQSCSEFE